MDISFLFKVFDEEYLDFTGAQLQSNVWLPLLRYTCIASPHNSSIVLVHLWHPEAGEPGMFVISTWILHCTH
jgi:hypothetical protein